MNESAVARGVASDRPTQFARSMGAAIASLQLAITQRHGRSLIGQYPHALIPQVGERRHCRFLQTARSWPELGGPLPLQSDESVDMM
ncbi:MAG: hypothetical protein JWO04_3553 [Gammaproteobacteria bacterium]|nr:hypothetical protein [Gammaproteobacteria bacterium]